MLSQGKIRVGVLRGGPSSEYKVSLETGQNVLRNLNEDLYDPVDIFISKDGAWHESGVARDPERILKRVDVVWNALHGKYGEDGEVQRLMDHFRTPYTGSNALSSAISINKVMSKKIYEDNGLKTPFSSSIFIDDLSRELIHEIYQQVPMPHVVKPATAGSSIGVYITHSRSELEEAVLAAFEHSDFVLIEEYIGGKEATCGVIDNFRNTEHYSLLPIEIRTKTALFDYNAKYSPVTEEISPGNFSREENQRIQNMAVLAHRNLGLRHYSRSDFRVHPKRGVFILETNTLPGLTPNSLIPKSLHSVGSNISEFLHHIISLALHS